MTILKTGACFTAELALNCPTIVGCVAALPVGPAAVAGTTQVLGKDGQYHALPAAPTASDGSETKVTAGTNTTVTGAGTAASPYVVSSTVTAAPITFATPAETVAGTSTTLAVNPADLYARENIPAQTGLSNNLASIPAPTASQSPFGVTACGKVIEYIPNIGWKSIAEENWSASASWGVCFASVAPTVGQVLITSNVLSVTNPDSCKAGNVLITIEARDNTFTYFAAGGIRIEVQLNVNGTGWASCGASGGGLSAGQSMIVPSGTFARPYTLAAGATLTAEARVVCIQNDAVVNQVGGCLVLSLIGVI